MRKSSTILKQLDNRALHLNQAFRHYLDSYEILTEIAERKLVDEKEFGLMKARTCLNCGKIQKIVLNIF